MAPEKCPENITHHDLWDKLQDSEERIMKFIYWIIGVFILVVSAAFSWGLNEKEKQEVSNLENAKIFATMSTTQSYVSNQLYNLDNLIKLEAEKTRDLIGEHIVDPYAHPAMNKNNGR